ncbi:MAG: hypothetical protein II336_00420 [Loktanella sp.]|nr:hypothetical protein [Loktanella sp.]
MKRSGPGTCLIAFVALTLSSQNLAAQDQNTIPLSQLDALVLDQDPQARYVRVIQTLDQNGYEIVDLRNTLLNRALIRARNQRHLREIVVSRASGQVLRDVVIEEFTAPPSDEPSPAIPLEMILENNDGQIRILNP